jgi:hypothetical protein
VDVPFEPFALRLTAVCAFGRSRRQPVIRADCSSVESDFVDAVVDRVAALSERGYNCRVNPNAICSKRAVMDVVVGEKAAPGGAHSSGSPALMRASRNPGGESIKPRRCASSHATESLGFAFIASASAAFASGA